MTMIRIKPIVRKIKIIITGLINTATMMIIYCRIKYILEIVRVGSAEFILKRMDVSSGHTTWYLNN